MNLVIADKRFDLLDLNDRDRNNNLIYKRDMLTDCSIENTLSRDGRDVVHNGNIFDE